MGRKERKAAKQADDEVKQQLSPYAKPDQVYPDPGRPSDPQEAQNFDYYPSHKDTWYELIDAEDEGLLTSEEYKQILSRLTGTSSP